MHAVCVCVYNAVEDQPIIDLILSFDTIKQKLKNYLWDLKLILIQIIIEVSILYALVVIVLSSFTLVTIVYCKL